MGGRDLDLRALFGSNDRGIQVEEHFTDRQEQWEAVVAALAEHARAVAAPGFDVEDLETPRDNVLVFHGVGGIGKSTLSRKVESALAHGDQRPAQWGAPVRVNARVLPVRIDLARSAGTDFERVVLTLRLALAELGRPLPAFDLALRRYWDHVHPGEPLEEFLRRGGLGRRFGRAVPQQMQSALTDIAQAVLLPGTVGAVVGQITGALVRALRDHRASVRALAGCSRLADLLEAEPGLDALSYYPHLLAWELARLPPARAVVPVILLDTFEDIGDRVHRDLERLLQRVVWLMPNAFFVVTGRSRLQWAEEALHGQLDWTGPAAWPGLAVPAGTADATAPGPARQILIGDFSAEDCDDYLARRLTRNGEPVMGPDVRAVITARSHGLPLHLDLAVQRFLAIRRTGRDPRPADLDLDFPALIVRTLSDLTPDERHVLRSVSLLDNFDVALASRAAGMTFESAALRMIERPFVRFDPHAVWPYHLHGVIRSTIRTAGDQADDRWSERDWTQAAVRALEAIGERWAEASAPGRGLLVDCLRQGLRLARDFGLGLGWLADAAWSYVADSVWEPLAPPAPDEPAPPTLSTAADALVETLSALARRQHEHREHTVARLTAVVDSGLLPAELRDMAVYYRAKALRDLGRSQDSRDGMRMVADGGGRLAPAARRGASAGPCAAVRTARAAGSRPAGRRDPVRTPRRPLPPGRSRPVRPFLGRPDQGRRVDRALHRRRALRGGRAGSPVAAEPAALPPGGWDVGPQGRTGARSRHGGRVRCRHRAGDRLDPPALSARPGRPSRPPGSASDLLIHQVICEVFCTWVVSASRRVPSTPAGANSGTGVPCWSRRTEWVSPGAKACRSPHCRSVRMTGKRARPASVSTYSWRRPDGAVRWASSP